MSLKKEKKVYNVVIVGSGAGGGMATKVLSESGLKVAVLEAGRDWDPAKEGIKDLGYKGNVPNEWDGVPAEILKKYGFSEDPKYKDVYVNPETRNEIMVWS